jgi:hypothetical protein
MLSSVNRRWLIRPHSDCRGLPAATCYGKLSSLQMRDALKAADAEPQVASQIAHRAGEYVRQAELRQPSLDLGHALAPDCGALCGGSRKCM